MYTGNTPLLLVALVLSFILSTVAIYLFSRLALAHNILLDVPTERKRHDGAIPLVGGLAIFVSFSVYSLLYGTSGVLGALYLGALWLMVVGLVDDLTELSSGFRFAVQITATIIIIYFGDAQILTLGNLLGDTEVRLERISLVFSVIAILGVINAINMVDGLDGLSGGITVMTLISLLVVSYASVGMDVLMLMVTLVGGLFAFILFNIGSYGQANKVFMGDAGSTVLGFILAWLFIVLSQTGERPLSPVAAGWLFGLPLLDSVSVMVRRLVEGASPFKADRKHLHHQLQELGFTGRTTLMILLYIHAVMLSVGIALNSVPAAETYFFWCFVALVIFRHFLFELKIFGFVKS